MNSKNRNRITVDIDPTLQARLECLADQVCCPSSGLVNLSLSLLLDQVALGQLDLKPYLIPSKSPRYDRKIKINNV